MPPTFEGPPLERKLRSMRRYRQFMFFALLAPVATTALIVLLNRLTGGALRFFVSGEPWTHSFWNTLFGLLLVGIAMAIIGMMRLCPRCGEAFAQSTGTLPPHTTYIGPVQMQTQLGRNAFTSRCLNCGVSLKRT